MADETGNVVYTVKELLAKLDGKVDTIILSLGSKAEKSDVEALAKRVVDLEGKVSLQSEVNKALRSESAANFTRREKIIGLLLALLAIAAQIYTLGGH